MKIKIEFFPGSDAQIYKPDLQNLLTQFFAKYDMQINSIDIIGHDVPPDLCPLCNGELVVDYEYMTKKFGSMFMDSLSWHKWSFFCNCCGKAGLWAEFERLSDNYADDRHYNSNSAFR